MPYQVSRRFLDEIKQYHSKYYRMKAPVRDDYLRPEEFIRMALLLRWRAQNAATGATFSLSANDLDFKRMGIASDDGKRLFTKISNTVALWLGAGPVNHVNTSKMEFNPQYFMVAAGYEMDERFVENPANLEFVKGDRGLLLLLLLSSPKPLRTTRGSRTYFYEDRLFTANELASVARIFGKRGSSWSPNYVRNLLRQLGADVRAAKSSPVELLDFYWFSDQKIGINIHLEGLFPKTHPVKLLGECDDRELNDLANAIRGYARVFLHDVHSNNRILPLLQILKHYGCLKGGLTAQIDWIQSLANKGGGLHDNDRVDRETLEVREKCRLNMHPALFDILWDLESKDWRTPKPDKERPAYRHCLNGIVRAVLNKHGLSLWGKGPLVPRKNGKGEGSVNVGTCAAMVPIYTSLSRLSAGPDGKVVCSCGAKQFTFSETIPAVGGIRSAKGPQRIGFGEQKFRIRVEDDFFSVAGEVWFVHRSNACQRGCDDFNGAPQG